MGADVAMKSVYRPLSINGPFPGGFFAFCHKDFGFLRSANHYILFINVQFMLECYLLCQYDSLM